MGLSGPGTLQGADEASRDRLAVGSARAAAVGRALIAGLVPQGTTLTKRCKRVVYVLEEHFSPAGTVGSEALIRALRPEKDDW